MTCMLYPKINGLPQQKQFLGLLADTLSTSQKVWLPGNSRGFHCDLSHQQRIRVSHMKGLMVVLKDRGSVLNQADSWIFYSESYYTRIPLPTSSLPDNSTGIRLKFHVSKRNTASAGSQYNLQTPFHKFPWRVCPPFTVHAKTWERPTALLNHQL